MADGDFTPTVQPMEFRLKDLRVGHPDPRGRMVRDILWSVNEFKIFKTDTGISPMFSDDPEVAQVQRKAYVALGPGIAEFNNLLAVLEPSVLPFTHKTFSMSATRQNALTLYERELARCIAGAFFGDLDGAQASLVRIREQLAARIRNAARVTHLLINIVLALVAITGAMVFVLSGYQSRFGFDVKELGLAVMMGSVGALFSTTVRLQSMDVDPTIGQMMHWVYGGQRVLVGALGALVIYFGFRSGVLDGFLQPPDGAVDPASGAYSVYWLSFVSVLAGFSERLVPNLLDSRADQAAPSGIVPG